MEDLVGLEITLLSSLINQINLKDSIPNAIGTFNNYHSEYLEVY